MAKTRLCIVLGSHWEAQMGGAQFQAKCLVDIIKLRPDFETFYVAHQVPQQLERDGYRIVPFGWPTVSNSLSMLMQLPSLYSRLKQVKPDVVYQRCLMPFTGVCALYCARHGARFIFHIASDSDPQILTMSGWSPKRWLHRFLRRLSEYGLRHADAVIAQTEDQARALREHHHREVTAIVPNFHPIPTEVVAPRDPAMLRVIWVGNLKPVKNPQHFVRLAESCADVPQLQFVMVGREGEDIRYRELHERIARLGNLKFLGELPVDEVNREVAASDVLVNTSSFEGFPNTFIQAWLRGVPVISMTVDPDRCLSEGGAGIVAGDLDHLIEVVRSIAADRARIARLGETAKAYALAHHHPDQAQKLVRLLEPAPSV